MFILKQLPAGYKPKNKESSPKPSRETKSIEEKKPSRKPEKVKLTEEEKERRMQEMMDNAKWRNEQREKNVQKYKTKEAKEKKSEKEGYTDDFMRYVWIS